jgi:hypothetical protein
MLLKGMLAKNSTETALAIGIRVMDGRIERIPGDVGNPATFPFPVLCRAVAGATLKRLITERDPIPRCKAFVNAHMQSAGGWKPG